MSSASLPGVVEHHQWPGHVPLPNKLTRNPTKMGTVNKNVSKHVGALKTMK